MTYKDFIISVSRDIQEQTKTNIRYNRDSINYVLLLNYILDTYEYLAKRDCYEFERRSIILRSLEDVAKNLGGFKLTLNTI